MIFIIRLYMKSVIVFFLFLLPVLHDYHQVSYAQDYPSEGIVKTVIDGDTIGLKTGEFVRYIGIDAPETPYSKKRGEEAFWKEATEANRKLVEGKAVRLLYDRQMKDKGGRLLAYVYVGDLFVNAELVRGGFALYSPFEPNRAKDNLLLQSEWEARKNKVGIWAIPLKNPSKQYVASKAKKGAEIRKFHRPGCPSAERIERILNRNKVVFSSTDEALDEGYRPCKRCTPLERK